MREYKIVILGSVGAGKTTAIAALAESAVVSTDVSNTDAAIDKLQTTVAMDYGDIALPSGDRIRVFGTPGQARFDFIWPILLTGAVGAMVLIDASSVEAEAHLAQFLHVLQASASDVPAVIGLTKTDLAEAKSVDALQAAAFALAPHLPLLAIDPRQREDLLMLMDILMAQVEAMELAVHEANA